MCTLFDNLVRVNLYNYCSMLVVFKTIWISRIRNRNRLQHNSLKVGTGVVYPTSISNIQFKIVYVRNKFKKRIWFQVFLTYSSSFFDYLLSSQSWDSFNPMLDLKSQPYGIQVRKQLELLQISLQYITLTKSDNCNCPYYRSPLIQSWMFVQRIYLMIC